MNKIVQKYFVVCMMMTALMPAAYSQMISLFKKNGPHQLPLISTEQKIISIHRPPVFSSVPVQPSITCLGGSGDERNFANFMITTNDGGFITCSYSSSNDAHVTGNHGSTDVWITKFDASGNLITIKYNNHEIKNYVSNGCIIVIPGIGNPCAKTLFSKA